MVTKILHKKGKVKENIHSLFPSLTDKLYSDRPKERTLRGKESTTDSLASQRKSTDFSISSRTLMSFDVCSLESCLLVRVACHISTVERSSGRLQRPTCQCGTRFSRPWMHLDVIGQDRVVDVPRCCQSKWYPSTVDLSGYRSPQTDRRALGSRFNEISDAK